MAISTSFGSDQQYETNNASWADAFSIEIPDGNTCSVHLEIIARGHADGTSALWVRDGCIKKVGGTVSLLPAGLLDVVSPQKNLGAALWDVSTIVDGNTLVVRVKGSSTQDVGWYLNGSVFGFITYHNGGVT